MERIRWRSLALLALLSLLLFACNGAQPPGPGPGPVQTQKSLERVVFDSLETSIKLYDLGMTTASTFYANKVISKENWEKVKAIGGKFYQGWTAAEKAAKTWAQAPETDPERPKLYAEVERLMKAYLASQLELSNLVLQLQKGGK